jgi:oligosaccharide repeat unit polymerase
MRACVILFICFVVWATWKRFNREYLKDAFSPLNILLYFWILPFLGSYMWLSRLQKALSIEATLIIVGSTILLVVTSLVPAYVLQGKALSIRQSGDLAGLRDSRWLVTLFFIVTLVAWYFAEFRDQDFPLILYLTGGAENASLHTYGKDSKLQVLAYGIFVATALGFYCGLYQKSRAAKLVFISMLLAVVVLAILKASKSDIYHPLLMCAAIYYYRNAAEHRRAPRLSMVWVILLVIALASVSTLRVEGLGVEGGYASEIQFRYSEQFGPVFGPIVATIYGYVSLGFQNFSNVIARSDDSWRLGTSFFRPLLSAFMQGDVARSLDVPVDQWDVVSNAANVGTYLTGLYIEGHAFACLAGSLVYGVLVNAVYVRFRLKGGGMWMFAYVAFIFPWTWLFFTNAFSVLSTFTNVFYVFGVFVVIRSIQAYRRRVHVTSIVLRAKV